jgi:hypothetical protein
MGRLVPLQDGEDTDTTWVGASLVRDESNTSGPAPAPVQWDWAGLTDLQVAKCGEYLAKMEFTLFGFDVYNAEVDDKGIDFVIRAGVDRYYDVQVRPARLPAGDHVFIGGHGFEPRPTMLVMLVLLRQHRQAELFLIPSITWRTRDDLLCEREHNGHATDPELGVQLSENNLSLLSRFKFTQQARNL